MSSNLVALAFASLLGIWTLACLIYRRRDLVAALPHNVAWFVGLLVVGSGLLNYNPTSAYAWLLMFCSVLAFNVAVVVASPASVAKDLEHVTEEPRTALVSRNVYTLVLAGFSVGFGIYLFTIARNYGLSVLIDDPTSLRSSAYTETSYQERFPLAGKLLFYLGPLAFVLTAFPSLVRGKTLAFWFRVLIMSYLVVAQAATLQRTNVFVCILWVVGMVLIRPRRLRESRAARGPSTLLGVLAVCVVALVIFQGLALALGKTGADDPRVNRIVDPVLRNSASTSVLIYGSSGIPAFGTLVESENRSWPPREKRGLLFGDYNPQTWGRATFAGPMKLLPQERPWKTVAPFVKLPISTNVYTWVEPWYRDFRLPGVVLGSLLLGFVISGVRRLRYSPEASLLCGLVLGLSGLAAFTFKYTSVSVIVLYIALFSLGWWRRRTSTGRSGVSLLTSGIAIDRAGRNASEPVG